MENEDSRKYPNLSVATCTLLLAELTVRGYLICCGSARPDFEAPPNTWSVANVLWLLPHLVSTERSLFQFAHYHDLDMEELAPVVDRHIAHMLDSSNSPRNKKYAISKEEYEKFVADIYVRMMVDEPRRRIGETFCDAVIRPRKDPSLYQVELTLWYLDGKDAEVYINRYFFIEERK